MIIVHHLNNSRSQRILWLLEELGLEYEIKSYQRDPQTMLVNENRLNLADPKARKYLVEQMEKHFFGEGADAASGYVPPKS